MRGLKIVVNGVFDLFHDGHKDLLNYALKFACGGRLLILVNTDESVAKLKGDTRPVVKLKERDAAINEYINSWCSINGEYPSHAIVSFDTEDELLEKIEQFKPDLLVKGNDYTDTTEITGHNICSVAITPRIGISTTEILQKKE